MDGELEVIVSSKDQIIHADFAKWEMILGYSLQKAPLTSVYLDINQRAKVFERVEKKGFSQQEIIIRKKNGKLLIIESLITHRPETPWGKIFYIFLKIKEEIAPIKKIFVIDTK